MSPARSRLLRQVEIAHRKRILDLGCGYGVVTEELERRGGGRVFGLDRQFQALQNVLGGVCGESVALPFVDGSFDLVFCQLALMWMPLERTAAEIGRVTMKGGVVVAIEPDYGGMLEWPEGVGLKEVWMAALTRAGADPLVGRKLPGALSRAGFEVRVETTSGIQPPAETRFEILRGLPLTAEEARRVNEVEKRSGVLFSKWESLVHLPFVLVVGTK
ncbi:MAG: methyltransferase domain-containing protein [Anaerolineales bacterium]|nr:methyltransferase domain-containing protein [Anaerolineales bacterium]